MTNRIISQSNNITFNIRTDSNQAFILVYGASIPIGSLPRAASIKFNTRSNESQIMITIYTSF